MPQLLCEVLKRWFCRKSEKDEKQGEQMQLRELMERVQQLENELTRRDETISLMRREYETLFHRFNNDRDRFKDEVIENCISKLVNRLAMLMTLASGYRNNLKVELEDVVNQIFLFEKELMTFGLEPIGRAGEKAKFDPSLHQPMGASLIADNSSVIVKIQGYKLHGKVLAKAVVTGVEG